jgi:hypothetical protein
MVEEKETGLHGLILTYRTHPQMPFPSDFAQDPYFPFFPSLRTAPKAKQVV